MTMCVCGKHRAIGERVNGTPICREHRKEVITAQELLAIVDATAQPKRYKFLERVAKAQPRALILGV